MNAYDCSPKVLGLDWQVSSWNLVEARSTCPSPNASFFGIAH